MATLTRDEWNGFGDAALGYACFEPLIRRYKELRTANGDERAFFREMTSGQQALFMFYALEEHIRHSAQSLFWWSAYFRAQPERWAALQAALRHLGDATRLELILDIDRELEAHRIPASLEQFHLSAQELDRHPELSSAFHSLYAKYQQSAPASTERIVRYIRRHAEEFVCFAS